MQLDVYIKTLLITYNIMKIKSVSVQRSLQRVNKEKVEENQQINQETEEEILQINKGKGDNPFFQYAAL